jgi:hypothetical protein
VTSWAGIVVDLIAKYTYWLILIEPSAALQTPAVKRLIHRLTVNYFEAPVPETARRRIVAAPVAAFVVNAGF